MSGDFGRGTEESFRQRGASIVLRGGGDGSSDAGNSAIASRSLPAEVAKCWHAALAQQPFEADGFDKPNADEQTRKAASAVHFSAASLSVSTGFTALQPSFTISSFTLTHLRVWTLTPHGRDQR